MLTADLERRIQALKPNATGGCYAYHRKNTKRKNMYGNMGIFVVNRQALEVVMIWLCLLPKIILRETVDGSRRR